MFLNSLSASEAEEQSDSEPEEDGEDFAESIVPVVPQVPSVNPVFKEGQKVGKAIQNLRSSEKPSFSLSYRDVEDSIRQYDGGDNYTVRRWLAYFEEMAMLTGWNDLQKLLFLLSN